MSEQKEVAVPTELKIMSNMSSINMSFSYSSSVIRVVGTINDPWFCGKDIATILEYKNTYNAIDKNVDKDDKRILSSLLQDSPEKGSDFNQYELSSYFINESGFYSLIMKSKLKTAKEFQRWVTSEVLPAIRKTGQYRSEQRIAELETKAKEDAELIERQQQATIRFQQMLMPNKPKSKTQIIYIVTSDVYSKNNRFKVGGCSSEELMIPRLSQYNTGRDPNDKFFYVNKWFVSNFQHAEKRIKEILGLFLIEQEKELYGLHYQPLTKVIEFILDSYNKEVNEYNSIINNLLKYMVDMPPAVVVPVVCNGAVITRYKNFAKVDEKTIQTNGSNLDEEQLKRAVNEFMSKVGKVEQYDFDVDKTKDIGKKIKISKGEFKKILAEMFFEGDDKRVYPIKIWEKKLKDLLTSTSNIEHVIGKS